MIRVYTVTAAVARGHQRPIWSDARPKLAGMALFFFVVSSRTFFFS